MNHISNKQWGATLWPFIHTITILDFDDPDTQRRITEKIIENLRGISAIIPCKKCAAHYDVFFQTEIDKRDRFGRMELFYLFVDFHNTINQKLRKPIVSHEDALLLWTKMI